MVAGDEGAVTEGDGGGAGDVVAEEEVEGGDGSDLDGVGSDAGDLDAAEGAEAQGLAAVEPGVRGLVEARGEGAGVEPLGFPEGLGVVGHGEEVGDGDGLGVDRVGFDEGGVGGSGDEEVLADGGGMEAGGRVGEEAGGFLGGVRGLVCVAEPVEVVPGVLGGVGPVGAGVRVAVGDAGVGECHAGLDDVWWGVVLAGDADEGVGDGEGEGSAGPGGVVGVLVARGDLDEDLGAGAAGVADLEEEGVVAGGGVASGDEVFAALADRGKYEGTKENESEEAGLSAHRGSRLTYNPDAI